MPVDRFAIEGPLLLTPQVFSDDQEYCFENWKQPRFAAARGVLRGLHDQLEPEPQGKLVRCVAGEIYDVAVDLHRSSPTFGQWLGARLSGSNHHQLWLPVGFAHGFLTLSETADVLYESSGFWSKACECSLRWNDPTIGIGWPLDVLNGAEPLLAPKDAEAPTLAEAHASEGVFA
jgi:dTDP-4-dehydrorhamnose 3,5-epimerase